MVRLCTMHAEQHLDRGCLLDLAGELCRMHWTLPVGGAIPQDLLGIRLNEKNFCTSSDFSPAGMWRHVIGKIKRVETWKNGFKLMLTISTKFHEPQIAFWFQR